MTDSPEPVREAAPSTIVESLRGVASVAACEGVTAQALMNSLGEVCDQVYGDLIAVIHRAGEPVGFGQLCEVCGAVLLDAADADGQVRRRSVAIPADDPEPVPPSIETGTPEHPEREITGNEPEMAAFWQAHEEWRARMDALAAPSFWPTGELVYEIHRWGVPTTFPRMTGRRPPLEEQPLEVDERLCGRVEG